ncbi:MAG TPA: hypothetical protein VGO93_12830 [Candidatus Xenobia bacterium]
MLADLMALGGVVALGVWCLLYDERRYQGFERAAHRMGMRFHREYPDGLEPGVDVRWEAGPPHLTLAAPLRVGFAGSLMVVNGRLGRREVTSAEYHYGPRRGSGHDRRAFATRIGSVPTAFRVVPANVLNQPLGGSPTTALGEGFDRNYLLDGISDKAFMVRYPKLGPWFAEHAQWDTCFVDTWLIASVPVFLDPDLLAPYLHRFGQLADAAEAS